MKRDDKRKRRATIREVKRNRNKQSRQKIEINDDQLEALTNALGHLFEMECFYHRVREVAREYGSGWAKAMREEVAYIHSEEFSADFFDDKVDQIEHYFPQPALVSNDEFREVLFGADNTRTFKISSPCPDGESPLAEFYKGELVFALDDAYKSLRISDEMMLPPGASGGVVSLSSDQFDRYVRRCPKWLGDSHRQHLLWLGANKKHGLVPIPFNEGAFLEFVEQAGLVVTDLAEQWEELTLARAAWVAAEYDAGRGRDVSSAAGTFGEMFRELISEHLDEIPLEYQDRYRNLLPRSEQ